MMDLVASNMIPESKLIVQLKRKRNCTYRNNLTKIFLLFIRMLRRSILTEKVARRGHHLTREYAVDPLDCPGVIGRLPGASREDSCWLVGYVGRANIMGARLHMLNEEQVHERGWSIHAPGIRLLRGR
jgi:hypothetical protein